MPFPLAFPAPCLESPLPVTPLARAAAAMATGAALVLAFPPYDLWFVACIVPAAFVLLVRDQPVRRSALLGLCWAGLLRTVPAMDRHGGRPGALAAACTPSGAVLPPARRGPDARPAAARLAGLDRRRLVAEEALRGRVPYGGFTWGSSPSPRSRGHCSDWPLLAVPRWSPSPPLSPAGCWPGPCCPVGRPATGLSCSVPWLSSWSSALSSRPRDQRHDKDRRSGPGQRARTQLDYNDQRRVITRNRPV